MTETKQEQTTSPEPITYQDLGLLMQIIELATQRGAFRGAELSQVGAIFDKLEAFVTHAQAQEEQQTPQLDEDEKLP